MESPLIEAARALRQSLINNCGRDRFIEIGYDNAEQIVVLMRSRAEANSLRAFAGSVRDGIRVVYKVVEGFTLLPPLIGPPQPRSPSPPRLPDAPTDFPLCEEPCPVCGKPRYETPSGPVCEDGHGG